MLQDGGLVSSGGAGNPRLWIFEVLWSVGQSLLLLLKAALAFFYLEDFNRSW